MSTLHLEVNDSGGWRRVMSFSKNSSALGDVMYDSERLLRNSDNPALKARIIEANGSTAPLMTWNRDCGWRNWPRGSDA